MTRAWWRDVCASPMAAQFERVDWHGLLMLAELEERLWRALDAEPAVSVKELKDLAGEIRLQRQCFGLTPIDRRRLDWKIEREDGRRKPPRPQGGERAEAATGVDVRDVLRVLSS